MTNVIPTCPDSARYNTSEAARLLQIDRGTLRSYAGRWGISPSVSRANGRAIWTGRQIKMIWRIVL